MLSRLLENWPYKLAAIAIAIALRLYVIDQSNNTRQIVVPITNWTAPAGLVVTDTPHSVRVTLSGSSGRLDMVTPDDLHATLDLRHGQPGSNVTVPVVVSLSTGLQSAVSVMDQDPRVATVILDKLVDEKRKISVHMNLTQFATYGYAYQDPVVTPDTATIEGIELDLAKVQDVWVWVDTDFSGSQAGALSIQGYYNVSAMDRFGNPVPGVTVSPNQARVVIPVTRVAAVKTMVVSPQITGEPTYPAAIAGVHVDPPMITVSGPGISFSQHKHYLD